jgi:hypothetical protein
MPVSVMLRSMPAGELTEWNAYFGLLAEDAEDRQSDGKWERKFREAQRAQDERGS